MTPASQLWLVLMIFFEGMSAKSQFCPAPTWDADRFKSLQCKNPISCGTKDRSQRTTLRPWQTTCWES